MCGRGTILGVSNSRLRQDLNSDQEPLGNAASSSRSGCPWPLAAYGQWGRQGFLSETGIFFSLKLSGHLNQFPWLIMLISY